jgi:hypothetical protein
MHVSLLTALRRPSTGAADLVAGQQTDEMHATVPPPPQGTGPLFP